MTTPPTSRSRRLPGPIWIIAGATIIAGLLVGLALALAVGADISQAEGTRVTSTNPTSPPAAPTASPTSAPPTSAPSTPTSTPSQAAAVRSLGIYYLGSPTDGYRLYREFRGLTVADDPITAAVDAMLQLSPLDDDYVTPWPQTSRVLTTTRSGDTVTIDLSADVTHKRAEKALVAAAIQQLVHTVTAADPTARSVRIRVGGALLTELWGHPIGPQPLSRAPAASTLAPVWIIDPAEGASMGRTFTASGTAEVFEATVSYEVTTADGSSVEKGSVIAEADTGSRGRWSKRFTLEPGTYVLRFFYYSADIGEPRGPDTKTIRVG